MDSDLRGEFWIGGTWVDATGKILQRQSVTHSRGHQDQGARVDPSVCRPLINNTDGRFSPDNPVGPYYGQFGRNTPFRLSVAAGTQALVLPGAVGDHASTPDNAALDITGDIDIRVDATLLNWTNATDGTDTVEVIAKMNFAAGERSWVFGTRNDFLYFEWSSDGSNALSASSTVALPVAPSGRIAIRVTLDVDNGASGRTITFYTAPTGTSGPWTQLGSAIVQAGTTSIFNSVAALKVGDATNISFTRATGRMHKAELRNGIAGTVVANPDFTAQPIGTTSFVDGAGSTWTMNGATSITNRRTRLTHEVAAYPTEWHPSGAHAWVDATTAGILRRLRRGNHALDSTLRRRIPSGNPLGYWPMEDGATATQFYSPIPGARPLTTTGMDLASDDSLAGSSALPVVREGARLSGVVPAPTGASTQWHTEFVFKATAPPTARTVMTYAGTGTVKTWRLLLDATGAQIYGDDSEGNTVTSVTPILTSSGVFGNWTRWRLWAVQNGGNVDYTVSFVPIGGSGGSVSNSYAGTVGRISAVASPPGYHADLAGMGLGHLSVLTSAGTGLYNSADLGFAGETAGARMARLASEESVPINVWGIVSEQTLVGPQRPDGFLSLLEEAADADGGILYEDREQASLRYRGRATMYNQTPALTLDYEGPGLAPPLRPTGDDDATENDVTVTRVGGSSARVVLEEGALSIQAPPNGVGVGYDSSYQLNLYSDDQTEQHAYWRLHLGTYDGRRYPQVRVMVHNAPASLLDQILAIDVGDKLVIQNPPIWVAPGDIELIVQGYEETFTREFEWDIVFNCTPGAPWTVGVVDDVVLGKGDTEGCELTAAITSSATTPVVLTTSGELWTTAPAQFPFGLKAGGEVWTATACASWLVDAFGRTVANGWGSADTGQAWSTGGGTSADYAVGSGYGSHTLATVGASRRTFTDFTVPDFEYCGSITTSVLATGASLFGSLTGRYADSDNLYSAQLEFTTANAIILTIQKRVTATQTSLGSYTTGLTHAAGTFVRVRFKVSGTSLRARVWLASDLEPNVWHVDVTDTSLASGSLIGTRSISASGNTNTNPVVRYDNLEIVNPQRFTVVRSVNGIVKAHSAGTPVSLAPSVPAAL